MTFNSNTILLSIIIPFRNEELTLRANLNDLKIFKRNQVEMLFVDDGSSDQGAELILNGWPEAKIIRLEGVGTGKAFYRGMKESNGEYVLLLPVDCHLNEVGFEDLLKRLHDRSHDVMVFPKQYSARSEMAAYSFLQNLILLRILRIAAWTNVFVLRRSLDHVLKKSTENIFLNDLELSTHLRSWKWLVLDQKIIVSPRRYHADGPKRRILINGIIVFLWFFGLMKTEQLYALYRRGK